MKVILLTIYKFGYPIAFDVNGITVVGISEDSSARCRVNDIEVEESFDLVLYQLERI